MEPQAHDYNSKKVNFGNLKTTIDSLWSKVKSSIPTKTSDLINDGNGESPLNPFVTADEVAQSVVCQTAVPEVYIVDQTINGDEETIEIQSSNATVLTSVFNGDGSYQRNGNNPGLNIPSRRMVEINGYIYWVGGENNINIYRTPSSGSSQSKTVWVTLDSTKFTSALSIVWNYDANCFVVAGNATHVAFISPQGAIEYEVLNENNSLYCPGLDVQDRNTWAVSTGYGNYNTLIVMTPDGMKQITPLKIYGFKFIDNILWITHQGGFGIGTYNFGLSKLDLNNLEQGFVNVLNFSTTDIYGGIYTIGKFPTNFFISNLRNALYIVSFRGYMHISKDGGETWNVYSLGTSDSQTVTRLATRSDGSAYIFTTSNYNIAMHKLTGLTGTNFSKTEVRYQSITQNYSFPVPYEQGSTFNYIYKEYMGQNRYTDAVLYKYDFNYEQIYLSLTNSGSYYSNRYVFTNYLLTKNKTYSYVLFKITSASTSSITLKMYSGPDDVLIIVDSPTWSNYSANICMYSCKKQSDTNWAFTVVATAVATPPRKLLATDEEIDDICV